MRIMAKYDFNIIATWEAKKDNRTEFVYLLEWPNKQTMTDVGQNSCRIRNGLRSRRRQANFTDHWSGRSKISPCILRIIHRVKCCQNEATTEAMLPIRAA